MTLRTHPNRAFGRPVASLHLASRHQLPGAPADLPRPVAILALCDCWGADEAGLRPLAAWLRALGANVVHAWGREAERLCHAVQDCYQEAAMDLLARGVEAGLEAEAALAQDFADATTWFYGAVELDEALRRFQTHVALGAEAESSRCALMLTVDNRDWAAAVERRLEDETFFAPYEEAPGGV